MSGPVPLKEVLEELSKKVGFKLRPVDRELSEAWRKTVGDFIAQRAQPEGIRRKVLWVLCPDPHWMNELQMLKETIKERLNALLGEGRVRDVRFKLGALPPSVTELPRPSPEVTLSPEEVEAVLSPLKDQTLRERALRILKAIKARGSS